MHRQDARNDLHLDCLPRMRQLLHYRTERSFFALWHLMMLVERSGVAPENVGQSLPHHDCIAPSTAATYHRRRSKIKMEVAQVAVCRCWNGVTELHRQSGVCHSPDMTASPYVRRVAPSRKIKGEIKWSTPLTKGYLSGLTSCLGHAVAYHIPHSLDSLIECQILLRLHRRFCFRYA